MCWQNQKGTSLATLSFGHSRDEHWRVSGATWIFGNSVPYGTLGIQRCNPLSIFSCLRSCSTKYLVKLFLCRIAITSGKKDVMWEKSPNSMTVATQVWSQKDMRPTAANVRHSVCQHPGKKRITYCNSSFKICFFFLIIVCCFVRALCRSLSFFCCFW